MRLFTDCSIERYQWRNARAVVITGDRAATPDEMAALVATRRGRVGA